MKFFHSQLAATLITMTFHLPAALSVSAAEETARLPPGKLEVIVTPRATAVARPGITGGGYPLHLGDRTLLIYPDHRDDFGGSFGTGSAFSTDGGVTWTAGGDDWPLPKMIDLWADRLTNGDLLAFGIHWVPDPKRRRESPPQQVPPDAYRIAISKDRGHNWTTANAVIDCPPEVGVIARPLRHIIDLPNGALLMPAYTWSRSGNRTVLLQSTDRGRHWKVRSVITTAIAIIKAGAPVSTPWLETTVAPTQDGGLLAIVRTGSNARSRLVSVRSTDVGLIWSLPEKLPFAGKLPTLQLLPGGVLTLVTALSRNHCRLYYSPDGAGRAWSHAYVISSLTGGNVGASIAGPDRLLLATPANRRIDAWHVQIRPRADVASGLARPTDIALTRGILTWAASPDAVAYRITPLLLKPGTAYRETEILPYAVTRTRDATPRLELGRQLLPGSRYAFKVSAVGSDGRVSSPTRSQDFQL